MRIVHKLISPTAILVLLAGCGGGGGTQTAQGPASSSSPGANAGQPASAAPLNGNEIALLEAAAAGDTARAKSLLDQGVNVNLRGSDGRTPLTEAAFAGHADMVKLLLDKGGDPSLKKADGADAFALGGGHKEVAAIFQNIDALIKAASAGDTKTVKALLDKGVNPNVHDAGGHTALTEASWNGHADTVKLLLDRGANPGIKKPDGASPADLARGQGHKDIEEMLNNAANKPAPQANASPASDANQKGPQAASPTPAKGKR